MGLLTVSASSSDFTLFIPNSQNICWCWKHWRLKHWFWFFDSHSYPAEKRPEDPDYSARRWPKVWLQEDCEGGKEGVQLQRHHGGAPRVWRDHSAAGGPAWVHPHAADQVRPRHGWADQGARFLGCHTPTRKTPSRHSFLLCLMFYQIHGV